jgi:hypothetical protein
VNELRLKMQKHEKLLWVIALGYTVFNGCFVFPFSNEMFPFDFTKALLVMFGYGMIGFVYVGLLDKGKGISVLVLTLLFTIIGLIGRYFLEFGEVSNAMNFIPINIGLYLVVVPIYCTLVYWVIWKWYGKISVI